MKYIDAEKLKYEIERRNLSNYHTTTEGYEEELYEIIDSLQQEQPEVDLEKEIDRVFFQQDCGSNRLYYNEIANIARHFAEWGAIHLNTRKEEKK